ncbi:MAG: hypothetical protein JXK16_04770 [Thiotrichales bacterium]|nr:hypothetical protein [Thiotrichales bacterium]
MYLKLFSLLITSTLLASCSNQQVYNAIQVNQQSKCQKLPPSQYDDCIKQQSESYEEYQRKLEAERQAK